MQAPPTAPRLRPLRVSELLDTVFSLYRRNFWLFLAVIALVQVPYQIVDDLLGLAVSHRANSVTVTAGHTLTSAQLHSLLVTVVGLLLLASVLLVLNVAVVVPLQTAAFTKAVADRFLDRPTTAMDCYRLAIRRWTRLLLLGLTYFGLVLAALVALSLVAFLLILLLGRAGGVLTVLVVLVGLIFGVFFYTRLSIASPALVLEGVGPWASIKRSWHLTSGQAGHAFGVLFSLLVVGLLIAIALGLLVDLAATAAGGVGSVTGTAVEEVGDLLAAVLVAPILASGLTLLYFDLRVRKEAFDLELLAQQISGENGPV
jgi:hypothetical protein